MLPDYRDSRSWQSAPSWVRLESELLSALFCISEDNRLHRKCTGYSWHEPIKWTTPAGAGMTGVARVALPDCDLMYGIQHDGSPEDVWLSFDSPICPGACAPGLRASATPTYATALPVVAMGQTKVTINAQWQMTAGGFQMPHVVCVLGALNSREREKVALAHHEWEGLSIHNLTVRSLSADRQGGSDEV